MEVCKDVLSPDLFSTQCVCIGYTMRMRGYRIYTTEGEARGRVYSMIDPESELYNWLVPECGGVSVSYWFIPSCPM